MVFIVLGYRCELTPALGAYLDRVAAVAREQHPALIISSGGATNQRTHPGLTEARLIADYLVDTQGLSIPVALEARARTTLENLRLVSHLLEQRGLARARLVVFCDRVRRRKIALIAHRLLHRARSVELRCHDFDRPWTEALVQPTLACLYEWTAMRLPGLEKLGLALIEARMRST